MAVSEKNGTEIRLNKVMHQWVIITPNRGRRPRDFAASVKSDAAVPAHDPGCPFCPGNEERLGSRILETGANGQWYTRVVANKFPALTPDGSMQRVREGIYLKMSGYGRHEVVIETPRHDRHPGVMSVEETHRIIETYHRRYQELAQQHGNMSILIFRNHGRRAGTSLIHPHSQIVVTGMVPQHVRRRENEALRYYDQFGRCVFCDILDFELRHRERVVMENDGFVGVVPFAADVPFEMWIMPRKHQADFGSIEASRRKDLAAMLQALLHRLCKSLHNPDYNYMINSTSGYRADEPHLHWYVRIAPRLTTRAGFEIGSGVSINPSVPEDDAAFLKR
jgi:UDPglucose--hexose-1-phosphate uridylyltransferase